ncbi:MAG: cyclic nucleotide-binding domain-containing protein [Verrucomicrobiae bacterium]|nr:cyclic nucleotide-binding domain-containing protein [Verrucomicrobiae bacterium]
MNSLTHEQASSKQCHLTPSGVLDGLDSGQIADLESMGIYMEYHRELVVADAGAIDYFFYIIKGNFEVSKVNPETKKKCVLATIGEGQCFGEMSFLTAAMASANVMANDEVVAWAIPHDSLRRFMETRPGGVRLGLNVATLLARRIQEGNTRLMGMSSTLSAYFGAKARESDAKAMESPQSADHAEMEIPDEVFDRFVREALGLGPDATLTEEHRELIRAKIESNQVDIVPWLEQGGSGRRLKVRLKFVDEQAAPMAVAAAAAAKAVVAAPRVVRVPQVRARISPAIAYAMRPPSLMSKLLPVAVFLTLPVLTILALFYCLSLDTRESIASSPGYRSLPFQGLCDWFVFSNSAQTEKVMIKRGAVYSLRIHVPKAVRLISRLDFPKKAGSSMRMTVNVVGHPDIAPWKVDVTPDMDLIELCSTRLGKGSYTFELICDEVPAGVQSQAVLTVTTRR